MTDFAPTRRLLLTGALAFAAAPALAQETKLDERGYVLGDMTLGAEDAPVTMYEYASLTCPHCAHFHTDTLPRLKENYIDTGKLRLVFREVYFDQFGLWAAMVSRCGGEQSYFGYVATFMEQMDQWARAEDIPAEIQRIGRLGGLSPDRMKECLSDEAFMQRLVGDFQTHAGADGVTSTPTFVIDGEKRAGAKSYEDMAAWIDESLAKN